MKKKYKLEKFQPLPRGTPPGTPRNVRDVRPSFRKLSSRTKPDLDFRREFVERWPQTR